MTIRVNGAVLAAAALLVVCQPAAKGQSYDLSWRTIDGGGVTSSTAGQYALDGTIGQPDAGPVLIGGEYELIGGFWAAGALCLGDMNGDGQVDLTDLATLLANFGVPSGATPPQGDLDLDGDVELADLSVMLSHFGTVCP